VRIFFKQGGGVIEVWTSALVWRKKNFESFEFMVCPHGQGGGRVELLQTFCGQEGESVNFSLFCAKVFFGRPLKF